MENFPLRGQHDILAIAKKIPSPLLGVFVACTHAGHGLLSEVQEHPTSKVRFCALWDSDNRLREERFEQG